MSTKRLTFVGLDDLVVVADDMLDYARHRARRWGYSTLRNCNGQERERERDN